MKVDTEQMGAWLEKVDRLPEPQRSQMAKWGRQQMARLTSLDEYEHPAALAASIEPNYVLTPAIETISEALQRTLNTRRGRLLITMPPQEGKSELTAVWTVLRALQNDQDTRIILASFSQELAEQASRRARNLIQSHGTGAMDPLTNTPGEDRLGLQLASDKAMASNWRLQGHKGGMVAVGFGGTITGRPADLLIIDDPLKGMAQSDSAVERRRVIEGFQGDLTTRLAPGAPIILIQTRWHEMDLAGWILAHEAELPPDARRWEHINIPAQAEDGLRDALGREPGEWLVSSRARTEADWMETKQSVGSRVWNALYQGTPTPLEGGLFSVSDLETNRVDEVELAGRIVTVDPAETGTGDEAGVLVMGWDAYGRMYVEDDWSAKMTSAQWARTAVRQALVSGAADIVFEAYTTRLTYQRVLEAAWLDVSRQAGLLRANDGDTVAAAEQWAAEGRSGGEQEVMEQTKLILDKVPESEHMPFRLVPWTKKGDKVARAAGARQSIATGRLRMLGRHSGLERQMVTWQPGQGSPDRVDALVNGHDHIVSLFGKPSSIAAPEEW